MEKRRGREWRSPTTLGSPPPPERRHNLEIICDRQRETERDRENNLLRKGDKKEGM